MIFRENISEEELQIFSSVSSARPSNCCDTHNFMCFSNCKFDTKKTACQIIYSPRSLLKIEKRVGEGNCKIICTMKHGETNRASIGHKSQLSEVGREMWNVLLFPQSKHSRFLDWLAPSGKERKSGSTSVGSNLPISGWHNGSNEARSHWLESWLLNHAICGEFCTEKNAFLLRRLPRVFIHSEEKCRRESQTLQWRRSFSTQFLGRFEGQKISFSSTFFVFRFCVLASARRAHRQGSASQLTASIFFRPQLASANCIGLVPRFNRFPVLPTHNSIGKKEKTQDRASCISR